MDFKIKIPRKTFNKIMYWVNKGAADKHEVSGFCPVDFKDGAFTLKDPFLLEQECSAADTEIDPVALGKAEFEHRHDPMGLKCHWHSHPNMSVYFSSTDKELMHQLGGESWLLALVFNEKYEVHSGLIYKTEFLGISKTELVEKIPVVIVEELNSAEMKSWDEQFTKNVTKQAWGNGSSHYNSGTYGTKKKNGIVTIPNGATKSEKKAFKKLEVLCRKHLKDKTITDLTYNNFDKNGRVFIQALGRMVYSPQHDDELIGNEDVKLFELLTMDQEEFCYLYKASYGFQFLVDKNIGEINASGFFNQTVGPNTLRSANT